MGIVGIETKKASNGELLMDMGMVNVREFGAAADGEADDTEAIRRALKALPEQGGVLFFPPGRYRSAPIEVPEFCTFMGHAAWSYRAAGGTVLSPASEDQPCQLDLQGKRGTRIVGLSLDGRCMGRDMHGIVSSRRDEEQNIVIDDCRIEHFSGSGIHLREAHVWAIRHSILQYNGLDGIDASGSYDFWIIDTQIAANGRAGLSGDVLGAGTITGNRIEHNRRAGILAGPLWPADMQITGNLFCSNQGPAIEITGTDAVPKGKAHIPAYGICITGNTLRYNGQDGGKDPHLDCQMRIEDMCGITVTGNTLFILTHGKPYAGHPSWGMVLKNLGHSVILGNSMYQGAARELIRDEGGHTNLVIRDNPGCLEKEGATPVF